MSNFHHLTPGAERVLEEAERRTRDESVVGSPFEHLLRALLESEGHASEKLRSAGIVVFDATAERNETDSRSFQDWRREVVRRADQFAIGVLEQNETGTEHLLLAAIALDDGIAAFAAQHGLTLEVLIEEWRSPPPELSVPDDAMPQLREAAVGEIDEAALFRILDASANRCREGLRVVEDFVRFDLDDAILSRTLKEIRHQLTQTLSQLGQHRWVSCRDTEHDVGTRGQLASERHRGSMLDVVRASCKRVEEALRSLEEYGKLFDAELSHRLTQCRYRFYTVEKGLESMHQGRDRLRDCYLYLLVTDSHCRYGAEKTIRNTIDAGVDVVQIREKHLTDRQLIAYGQQVRRWTQEAGTLLVLNDRPDLAVAIGADGVHLGQDDLDIGTARRILGARGLIGISTHHIRQARDAIFSGADYLGVGPVFPSQTKDFEQFAGLDYVREVSSETSIPWFAIGGITQENLAQILIAGGRRVAVSSAICTAANPRGVAQRFRAQLHQNTDA